MRINFGGRDALVSQQLLHDSQIRAAFHQVSGEAVPQRVGADVFLDAGLGGEVLNLQEDALAGQSRATHAKEDRICMLGFARQMRAFVLEVEL